jgi:hypothetical protein
MVSRRLVIQHQLKLDCMLTKEAATLLRLSLPNPATALTDLRRRYDELAERKDFLPYEFNLRLPQGLDIDKIISYLPPAFLTIPPAPAPTGETTSSDPVAPGSVNRVALAMAVIGWQDLKNARDESVPNTVSCHTCLRRLGLWMFRSKQVDPETNAILEPALIDHLDPVSEHRDFCPWKNAEAQRNGNLRKTSKTSEDDKEKETDKPAWAILVQTLRNEAFVRSRVNAPAHEMSKSVSAPDAAGATGADLEHVVEDDETRKKRQQAMMARLRKVKSLFNVRPGPKLKKAASQPQTGSSAVPGAEGAT